jgi:hypothetical protein
MYFRVISTNYSLSRQTNVSTAGCILEMVWEANEQRFNVLYNDKLLVINTAKHLRMTSLTYIWTLTLCSNPQVGWINSISDGVTLSNNKYPYCTLKFQISHSDIQLCQFRACNNPRPPSIRTANVGSSLGHPCNMPTVFVVQLIRTLAPHQFLLSVLLQFWAFISRPIIS